MTAPVDIPQNLHIHVVPAQKIPEPKQPDASNNSSQEFQDYFEKSQEKIQEKKENKRRRKKYALPVGIKPEEKMDDYDDTGEMTEEKKTEINDLGNHIDTKI